MAQPKKLVIAGIGLVGRRHAEAIRHIKKLELSGIVDPSAEGEAFADGLDLPCYASMDAMFDAQSPDGVVLSTPTLLHVEQALECVAQHCPVLVEKPIATNATDALRLVNMAEQQQVPLLVGHHRRHNPIIQKAHEIIENGEIGQVRAIHANCWFYKPDSYFDIAPWRKKKGAGPISINLVHDVDLIRYLCGEVVSVQAQARQSIRGFENEDVAAAVLRFSNGVIGTISVADAIAAPWSWELTSGEYPVYPQTAESCYFIGASEGALSIPDLAIWRHAEKPDWWSPISASKLSCPNSDPLINQMEHFCEVIEGKVAPLVSGLEALKTLRVVEAIQKSAQNQELTICNH